MTRNNTSVTLGKLGENLIKQKIVGATKTDDWYDRTKDGTIGTRTYEVKTARLNNKHQGFFLDESQYNKIDNVDINFYVRVPETPAQKIKYYRYYADRWIEEFEMNGTLGRLYHINHMDYIGVEKDPKLTIEALELSKALSTHGRFI
tara:strand:+ start:5341 stop:5781 length:441 start_codon:yes stop_codon:yes gene_type:complete